MVNILTLNSQKLHATFWNDIFVMGLDDPTNMTPSITIAASWDKYGLIFMPPPTINRNAFSVPSVPRGSYPSPGNYALRHQFSYFIMLN
jgi:hypothetical protein